MLENKFIQDILDKKNEDAGSGENEIYSCTENVPAITHLYDSNNNSRNINSISYESVEAPDSEIVIKNKEKWRLLRCELF